MNDGEPSSTFGHSKIHISFPMAEPITKLSQNINDTVGNNILKNKKLQKLGFFAVQIWNFEHWTIWTKIVQKIFLLSDLCSLSQPECSECRMRSVALIEQEIWPFEKSLSRKSVKIKISCKIRKNENFSKRPNTCPLKSVNQPTHQISSNSEIPRVRSWLSWHGMTQSLELHFQIRKISVACL